MTCNHRYRDVAGPTVGSLEVDGRVQIVEVCSLSECTICGDVQWSIRLEDGSMWIELGGSE